MSMLHRRDVVARLLRDRTDLVVITGLGAPTYDVAAAGDHDRNFHLWGAMGGAAVMGMGLACARPGLPVAVITGDGEALMGMGGFATIASQQPANLTVVILDNGQYGETGAQPSHTAGGTDLAAVARACGIADTRVVTDQAGVAALAFACTGLAYLLYFRLIAHAGPANAIAVTYLIPVFAVLWGAMFLGEQVTAVMVAGCGVILLGTALATGLIGERRSARAG